MKIAIIPARGGSKRIKDKNIMPFCGQPMILHALGAAKASGLFDEIHVSTDSEAIRSVVENAGFKVAFMRDPALADDHTAIAPVLQWVLKRYQKLGRDFEDVCLLMPCAPLIVAEDLRKGFELYLAHRRRKALLAISEYPVPIEWAFKRADDGALQPVQPGMFAVRSQDLGKKYYDSGIFIFFNAASLLSDTPPADDNYIGYQLPRQKSIDIDTPEDLELARLLYLGRAAAERTPND